MKRIIFTLNSCLFVFFLFAVNNDQSYWSGNLADFKVNEDTIQLESRKTGRSYLTTSSTRYLNTRWSFQVKLAFNPSSSNYMDVYLCAEEPDLDMSNTGYFIRIGHTNDNICLYRKSGTQSVKIIDGIKKRLDLSSIDVEIGITCSFTGEWSLYSKLNDESDFLLEGSGNDYLSFNPNCFGILCVYTTTRGNGFNFSNRRISIFNNADEEILKALSVPEHSDVLFSEILFNGTEYVEFYNNSQKDIDLSKLYFAIRRQDGSFSKKYPLSLYPKIFPSKSFLVISKYIDDVCNKFICNPSADYIVIENMPALNNSGADLILLDEKNEIIDEFLYSDKMHYELIRNKKDIALERMDYNAPTENATNWQTASSDSGCGTPGYQNSQMQHQEEASFQLSNNVFQFCGEEKVFLTYRLKNAMNATIHIYNSTGKHVKKLANNLLLGTNGFFLWDGIDFSGNNCNTGIYILYIECFDLQGGKMVIKRVFSLNKC